MPETTPSDRRTPTLPPVRNLAAELVDRGDGWHVSPETLVDEFLRGRPNFDLNVERPYVFSAGPWAGKVTLEPRAVLPQHCMPTDEDGAVWAMAAFWPGRDRYVPDQAYAGDAVRMVWRVPTVVEVDQAVRDAKERDAITDWDDV